MVQTVQLVRTATALSRNPLGLVTVAFVFVYGVAGAVGITSMHAFNSAQRTILLVFLVVYPLILLAVLYRLVSRHHTKLYAPQDFREEGNFVALGRASMTCTDSSHEGSLGSGRVVFGDDFSFVVCTAAANQAPRPRPGFYLAGEDTYYVGLRHRIFLLRSSGPSRITPVPALPAGATPIAREDCGPELRALADAADSLAI